MHIEGDTLVVTKLDRLARSAVGGIKTIKQIFEKGVRVHVLNMGMIENTPTGKLIFNVMIAFAEFERDMIVERRKEEKTLAKNPEFREREDHDWFFESFSQTQNTIMGNYM